ncbi:MULTISPECIES: hypothetical protein [Bradyrhizobium]|uniref:Uncharacterized protein n=1 Tax=Bradyrhizobium septentrionale TaxID=1404411 RepID=A0A973W1L6_9BRAD|nr:MULTISPECIES: hypothetical protein [Bradyrhizobium]MCK7670177.1 hypothetical protein [Bradyrhizobium sp. 2S1]UGY14624.1 hypothetical protein HAP48_0039760 [Bradyrhizobium septentrionale]UGY23131.1 hypothetical protein HU675_0035010 [Bradyrhizobium septentrionale]
MTHRPAALLPGVYPPRQPAAMAAGYCGEISVESFLREVKAGTYPQPAIKRGRRQIWLTAELDRAMAQAGQPCANETAADVAADF